RHSVSYDSTPYAFRHGSYAPPDAPPSGRQGRIAKASLTAQPYVGYLVNRQGMAPIINPRNHKLEGRSGVIDRLRRGGVWRYEQTLRGTTGSYVDVLSVAKPGR
ncbi:MAG: hypothetical protein PVH80_04045, partial [Anaerolineae bacterium]